MNAGAAAGRRVAARRVAVVGDGPAGAAVAGECVRRGLEVVLHGRDEPWTHTYATWRDDVAHLPDDVFASVSHCVVAVGRRHHELDRPYAVFDNGRLRTHLLAGVGELRGDVAEDAIGAEALDVDVVIDSRGAGGPRPAPRAWQTAFGIVVAEPLDGMAESGRATLMDWRPAADDVGAASPPSFCYVVPVRDGWLVEETVLAAAVAVEPADLLERLVARLDRAGHDGRATIDAAARREEVRIPMGGPIRPRTGRATTRAPGAVVPFGAAAGYVHPATGYSVAASLRAAPRVARAIAEGDDVASAVWPRAHRRARALHDFGLDALLRLDGDDTAAFFDAFFDLPVHEWSQYLRVDTTPGAVAGVMRRVFRSAPWPVRRRLMAGNPLPLLRRLAAS